MCKVFWLSVGVGVVGVVCRKERGYWLAVNGERWEVGCKRDEARGER